MFVEVVKNPMGKAAAKLHQHQHQHLLRFLAHPASAGISSRARVYHQQARTHQPRHKLAHAANDGMQLRASVCELDEVAGGSQVY